MNIFISFNALEIFAVGNSAISILTTHFRIRTIFNELEFMQTGRCSFDSLLFSIEKLSEQSNDIYWDYRLIIKTALKHTYKFILFPLLLNSKVFKGIENYLKIIPNV